MPRTPAVVQKGSRGRVAMDRAVAMGHSLPYGAVMATAGASVLALQCRVPELVNPLLALAVVQALWIPMVGMWHQRRELRSEWQKWCALGEAHGHTGVHTVPLGLAVIAGGLATLAASGTSPWMAMLALVCLGLAWLFTVIYAGRFVWSLALRGLRLQEFDGAWFLVPAALLGASIATVAVAGLMPANPAAVRALTELALVGTLLGWVGYWAVLGATVIRLKRIGLGGVPQTRWWIAMGCAGLAAAALGRVLQDSGAGMWMPGFLGKAMVVTGIVAILLCVPVIVGSSEFLLRRCHFRAPASWPPTFSTAVFALGCLEIGKVLPSSAFRVLGLVAGYATILLWFVTAIWNMRCTCAHGPHCE